MINTSRYCWAAIIGAVVLYAQCAFAFEFHGYMRAGTGGNSDGGDQVCFLDPGAGAKYRLGNECEIYGEWAFSQNLFEGENNAYFKYNGMMAFAVEGEQDFEQTEPAFRQSWIEAGNLFDGFFRGAIFWAGKRFYRRHDVHINDFFYWGQGARTGAGAEDVDVGFGNLAFAWFSNANDDFDFASFEVVDPVTGLRTGEFQTIQGQRIESSSKAVNSFDLRLYNIETNPGGLLTLGIDGRVWSESDKDFDPSNGVLLNAIHFQDGFLGGFNKLALQYGNATASSLQDASSNTAKSGTYAYRLVETLLFQPNETWSGMWTLVYEKRHKDRSGEPIDWWFSTGIRPKYYFTDYLDVSVELGYDRVNPQQGSHRDLFKATIAPEISAGRGFFARPALRVFLTYANWNSAARKAGVVLESDGTTFEDANDGFTYGVQAEAWW